MMELPGEPIGPVVEIGILTEDTAAREQRIFKRLLQLANIEAEKFGYHYGV